MSNEKELQELKAQKNTTARATSESLEKSLYDIHKVLDKGFVRVIDYMGNDSSIVQAARVSYGKGTKSINDDELLIRYLMRNKHTTPFEMCEIKFHIKCPIFVARQWLRHRTANVNEYSARYSIMSNDFYIPEDSSLLSQSSTNKQGREDRLSDSETKHVANLIERNTDQSYANYQDIMNTDSEGNLIDDERKGLTRELSRIVLPLNVYTEFYWKIDLHNLLHFLRLRAHSHAQYEIQEYAYKMLDLVKLWVPLAYKAFEDYVKDSATLSKNEIDLVKKMLKGENITQENSNLSKREFLEFENKILKR